MVKTAVATDGPDDEWMSTAEAARFLGITPRTLYRFIDQEVVPAYRFGRVIRLRSQDVIELALRLGEGSP
jgi:excisionase family DNA binding protein